MSRIRLFRAFGITALCILVIAELSDGEVMESRAVASAVAIGAPSSVVPNPNEAGAKDLLGIVLDRPLFEPSRRAAQMAAPNLASENLVTPQQRDEIIRVVGIIGQGETKYAVFETKGTPKSTLAATGDEIGGWKVDQITETGVRLTGQQGIRNLEPAPNLNPAKAAIPIPQKMPDNASINVSVPFPGHSPVPELDNNNR